MTAHPFLDDYLAQLRRELTLPRRMRARVLAETEDHLLCAVADLARDAGSQSAAEREAIARYGSAKVVAHSYARAMSSRATARLAAGVVASLGSFVMLFVATTQIPAVQAGAPAMALSSGAAGAVGWIALQLAAVCGALALVRCWRLRGQPAVRAGTLRLATRSAATAVGAIGLSLLFDVAALVRMAPGQGQHAALVFGLALCSMAMTAGAGAHVLVAQRRLRALGRYGNEPASQDALDDVRAAALAILRVLADVPIAGRVASAAQRFVEGALAAGSPVTRVLRSHPWRFGAAVALLIGLLASAVHFVAEGPPTDSIAVGLLVALIITAIEGVAVFGCYALFGRFLGIRNPDRSQTAPAA